MVREMEIAGIKHDVFVLEDAALKHAEEHDALWKAALYELRALHLLYSDAAEFDPIAKLWVQNFSDCGVFEPCESKGSMVVGTVSSENIGQGCFTRERNVFRNVFYEGVSQKVISK